MLLLLAGTASGRPAAAALTLLPAGPPPPCATGPAPDPFSLAAPDSASLPRLSAALPATLPGETCLYAARLEARQLGGPEIQLIFPLDLGRQGRADPEFAPFYLPEAYPGLTFQQMAGADYLSSPMLAQDRGDGNNPFLIKQEEVQRLAHDASYRWRRLAQVTALTYLYRGEIRPESAVNMGMSPSATNDDELIARVVLPPALKRLPPMITGEPPEPGQIAVDLAVHTSVSYDSVAPVEAMLLAAAKRGLSAVAIVDRGRIDGAELAASVAEQLKAVGRLPANFTVILGEDLETTAGGVVAIFLRERVPERMTMRATLREIHRQGGLAYLENPGSPGGRRLLEDLPFDGYLVRPGLFQTLRTLPLMRDKRLQNKSALYASDSLYAPATGLPSTYVDSASTQPEAIRQSLLDNQAYSMGGIYLPYTIALAYKPLGKFVATLNRFFEAHDEVESGLTRALHADNVQIVTSWDGEMQDWMGLLDIPGGVQQLARGHSPFNRLPQLEQVAADYGDFRVGYSPDGQQAFIETLVNW
jgi:hypothetical protein